MRGLQVYFCPKCGFYSYYQLAKNAVCPKCNTTMRALSISYTDFMDMDCKTRDEYIGEEMIRHSKPLSTRLSEPHQQHNNREQIGLLLLRIQELEEENKKLNETVSWMHDTIWQLLREKKGLEPSPIETETSATINPSAKPKKPTSS